MKLTKLFLGLVVLVSGANVYGQERSDAVNPPNEAAVQLGADSTGSAIARASGQYILNPEGGLLRIGARGQLEGAGKDGKTELRMTDVELLGPQVLRASYRDVNLFVGNAHEIAATVDVISVGAHHKQNFNFNSSRMGALLKFLEARMKGKVMFSHGLFNHTVVDFCANLVGAQVTVGPVKDSKGQDTDARVESMAAVCGGIELGQFGKLVDEISFGTDWNGYTKIANTLSLKEMAGTKVEANIALEREIGADGKQVDRGLVGAKLVF